MQRPERRRSTPRPDTYLYDGTDPTSQLVGLEWNVASASAPDGFTGDNDVWVESSTGVWTLHAWIVRPFENQVEVFAPTASVPRRRPGRSTTRRRAATPRPTPARCRSW